MQLTGEELKAAALAPSTSYLRHIRHVRSLRDNGEHVEAESKENDYAARLNGWIETIKETARKGEKK